MNTRPQVSRTIALAVLCLLACVDDCLAAEPMQYPLAVAVADDGTIYVADLKLPGIWEIREGTRREYFRGSKKFRTPLNAVRCLAIDQDGRLLAGDSATREIYRFDADAKPQRLARLARRRQFVLHLDGALHRLDGRGEQAKGAVSVELLNVAVVYGYEEPELVLHPVAKLDGILLVFIHQAGVAHHVGEHHC